MLLALSTLSLVGPLLYEASHETASAPSSELALRDLPCFKAVALRLPAIGANIVLRCRDVP